MTDPLYHRDGPRDECGVFGVYAPESEVARLAYFALYALQHRGQESAGIATCEGGHIMTVRDLGLVSQVFDEQKLKALTGRDGHRPCALLHHRLLGVGERAARLPLRPPPGRPRAQRQPDQRGGAALRAHRQGRPVPFHLGLGDHRRAALHPRGGHHRGGAGRRDAAPGGRLLHRGDDPGQGGRLPRRRRPAAALPRSARRPLLRGLGELRLRHHRRGAAARGPARRDGLDRRARDRDPPGGRLRRARPSASSSTSTSRDRTRSSRATARRSRGARWARSSGARRRWRPTW